jgi:hypothetical protein
MIILDPNFKAYLSMIMNFKRAKGNSPLLRIFDSTLVIVSNLHVYNLPWLK